MISGMSTGEVEADADGPASGLASLLILGATSSVCGFKRPWKTRKRVSSSCTVCKMLNLGLAAALGRLIPTGDWRKTLIGLARPKRDEAIRMASSCPAARGE